MCGIVGKLEKESNFDLENSLEAALARLKHRGPDDRGHHKINVNGWGLCLGHTRLAILDLSPSGHQPMVSNCGNYCIVFNGEIYNYLEIRSKLINLGIEFRSKSDTEVLLYLWQELGVGCLEKIEGMYAFCIYDKFEDILWIVRDRMGIKPLYYYINDTLITK